MSTKQALERKAFWSRIRSGNLLLVSAAGLLILLMFAYLAIQYKAQNPTISFSPSDVTFGIPFRAGHLMGNEANTSNNISTLAGTSGHPLLEISERFYDFGSIDPNAVATRTFVIANRGDAPLIITRAYTTCGCTVADFSAQVIPPGKVVLMTLKFDPAFHHLHGVTVRRGVMIETNDEKNPSAEIWIQASVR